MPDVPRAVEQHPPLLAYDVRAQMKPPLDYLLSLGVSDLGAVVQREPRVLGCDLSELNLKVAVLRSLGVANVGWWLRRNPRLASLDLEADMRPVVALLRGWEGVDVGRVVAKLPGSIFALGEARLRARLEFLQGLLDGEAARAGAAVSKHLHLHHHPPPLSFDLLLLLILSSSLISPGEQAPAAAGVLRRG